MTYVTPKAAAAALGMTVGGLKRMVSGDDDFPKGAVISTAGGHFRYDIDRVREALAQRYLDSVKKRKETRKERWHG